MLWRALGQMLEHASDLSLQDRQIPFHHGPDFPQVYPKIVMDQDMPHFDDLRPRDLLMSSSKRGSQRLAASPMI